MGGSERLRDESILFGKQHENVKVVVYEDQVHTFQVFGEEVGLQSYRSMAEFVRNGNLKHRHHTGIHHIGAYENIKKE